MNDWTIAYGTLQQEKECHETFDFLVWVCKLGKTAQLQTQCWLLLSGSTLILHIHDYPFDCCVNCHCLSCFPCSCRHVHYQANLLIWCEFWGSVDGILVLECRVVWFKLFGLKLFIQLLWSSEGMFNASRMIHLEHRVKLRNCKLSESFLKFVLAIFWQKSCSVSVLPVRS